VSARRPHLFGLALGVVAFAHPGTALAQDAENPGARLNQSTEFGPTQTPPPPPDIPAAELPRPAAPTAPGAAVPPAKTAPGTPTAAPAGPPAAPPQRPLLKSDRLDLPGYVPGYRSYEGLGLSPYAPRVPGLAGGLTPSFGAPSPTDDWTFTFGGYMSATLQFSINERLDPQSGQSSMVLHTPPSIVEEYAAFPSTTALPGNWIGANLSYGTSYVTATVSLNTWNPTGPTNQPGGQYFINNMFLKFRAPPIEDKLRLGFTVGFFNNAYGALGRYGGGFYTNPLTGEIQGAGVLTLAEYDLSDKLILVAEHGIMSTGGPREGFMPAEVIEGTGNGGNGGDPQFPAAFVHHAHLGMIMKGDLQLELKLHFMTNWAQDDRVQRKRGGVEDDPCDIPTTIEVNECFVPDGRMRVYGFDVKMLSSAYGVLGVGASYITGHYAEPLKGVRTFGGDGEQLTSSWWGLTTQGNGKLWVAGISYSMSVASLMLHPEPFNGQAPDIQLDAGFNIGKSTSSEPAFSDRVRHKYGLKGTYTFLPFMGAGLRVDRVVPSSKDPEQTFHVLNPWIQFKSSWTSHETISLSYVKWFLGDHTHLDGLNPRYAYGKVDDQMVALNFNMWW
jgi:hypothetical protein